MDDIFKFGKHFPVSGSAGGNMVVMYIPYNVNNLAGPKFSNKKKIGKSIIGPLPWV